jgi:hypothetical protein
MPQLKCPGCGKTDEFPLLRKTSHGCGTSFRIEKDGEKFIFTVFQSVSPNGLGAALGIGTRNVTATPPKPATPEPAKPKPSTSQPDTQRVDRTPSQAGAEPEPALEAAVDRANQTLASIASERALVDYFGADKLYDRMIEQLSKEKDLAARLKGLQDLAAKLSAGRAQANRYVTAKQRAQAIVGDADLRAYAGGYDAVNQAFQAAQGGYAKPDAPTVEADAMEAFVVKLVALQSHVERYKRAKAEVEKLAKLASNTDDLLRGVEATASSVDRPAAKADAMERLLAGLQELQTQRADKQSSQPPTQTEANRPQAATTTASRPQSSIQAPPQTPSQTPPTSQPQPQPQTKPQVIGRASPPRTGPVAGSSGFEGLMAQVLELKAELVPKAVTAIYATNRIREAEEARTKSEAEAVQKIQAFLDFLLTKKASGPGTATGGGSTTTAKPVSPSTTGPKTPGQSQGPSGPQTGAKPQPQVPPEPLSKPKPQPQPQGGQAATTGQGSSQGIGSQTVSSEPTTPQAAPKTVPDSPAAARKRKNESALAAVTQIDARIKGADPKKKEEVVDEALSRITKIKDDELRDLPVAEQIGLLKQVQIPFTPDGKPTEAQKKALVKIYRTMRIDPDFEQHDRERRQEVLTALVADSELVQAHADWDMSDGLTPEKKRILEKAQKKQCDLLGFKADPIKYEKLKDGNAGLCVGKTVKVSTDPKAIADFNEVIDTVIHETTHAYQHYLVELLDAGKLTVDDPRYAQAWLFKLNGGHAYLDPPDKVDDANKDDAAKNQDYKDGYAAYKDQPTEMHAWRAGNEAGRAFDVKALALDMASLVDDIVKLTPSAASKAAALQKRLDAKKSIMEGTEMLAEIDTLAQAACDAADERAKALIQEIGGYADNGFKHYSDEWKRIGAIASPRKRMKGLKKLIDTMERLAVEGKRAEAACDAADTQLLELLKTIGQYVDGGFETYGERRLEIAKAYPVFSARLPQIQALIRTIEQAKAVGEGDKKKYDEALAVVDKLGPSIGNYVDKGYQAEYVDRRELIVEDKALSLSQRLSKMTALRDRLIRLTEAGEKAKSDWSSAWELIGKNLKTQVEIDAANKIGGMNAKPAAKLAQLRADPVLADARKRAGFT